MNKRRLGALGLAAVLGGGALAGSPAGAQSAEVKESFAGSAKATALHLNLLGTDLTLTDTFAEVGYDEVANKFGAVANGTEVLTPLFTSGGKIVAEAKAPGQSQDSTAKACTFDQLTLIPGIKNLVDVGCPRVSASVDAAGLPKAQSLGAQLKLDLSISEILDTLQIRKTVAGEKDHEADDGLDDQVIDATLGAIAEGLTGTPIGELVDDSVITLDNLLEDVLGLDATVRIAVAPAVSEITSTNDLVDVHAKAQGLRIEILPLDELAGAHPNRGKYDGILEDLAVGEPLLTIVIGEAEGQQQLHRGANPTVETVKKNAALARIKIGGVNYPLIDDTVKQLLVDLGLSELLVGIGADLSAINVPPLAVVDGGLNVTFDEATTEFVVKGPGTLTVLEGTPLETSLVLAAVDEVVDGSGKVVGFSGSGAQLHALKGVNGGVYASLADITGSAGGLGVPTEVQPRVIDAPKELPRTGGTPMTAIAGMALLGLALATRRLVIGRSEA